MKKTVFSVVWVSFLFYSATIFSQNSNLKAYANYDFVPGDKILFEDDFRSDTDGEFPNHWELFAGQGVVNKVEGQSAFLFTDGSYAKFEPSLKKKPYLNSKGSFSIEFDYLAGPAMNYPRLFFIDENEELLEVFFELQAEMNSPSNSLKGTQAISFEEADHKSWHHAALIYTENQMKCYIDQTRSLVIPKVNFDMRTFHVGGSGSAEEPTAITNFKLAEGGDMNLWNKLIQDGRIVSHGIHFDVNKSNIKPESMGTLNEIVKLMKQHPEVKFEIGGHTDGDGDDASNLILSQERADAVKKEILALGIAADRITTKGYGETKPVGDNKTFEGKAENRRVEFVKM